MSKGSSSGGFRGWGTAGVLALLVSGGIFAKNYFNSPTINITGNNNDTAGRDIDKSNRSSTTTNMTVYGNADSLLVVPASTPTITSFAKPESSTALASEYALQVTEPPILLKPMRENDSINYIAVAAGQDYKLDFVVNYKSKTPTKFYANILPDAESRDITTYNKSHLDNVTVTGRSLEGDGTMKFSLRGKAPTKKGAYERSVSIGLMDYKNWMKQSPFVTYMYSFAIIVVE